MDALRWAGGVAALGAAAILAVGLAGLVRTGRRERPWLVVLLGFNAGRSDIPHDALRAVRPVDVLLLVLAGTAYAGFWPGPEGSHRWWMVLAIGQPLAGIAVLVATRLAGRSGLMGGALVLSLLMVADDGGTAAGWLGIGAAGLLLVGDVATTDRPRRRLAPVLAAGCGALIVWFGWVAGLLLGPSGS